MGDAFLVFGLFGSAGISTFWINGNVGLSRIMKFEIRQELIIFLAMYLVLLILPVFLYKDAYVIGILITCMVWGAMASVWNFTMGYAGIFTFGQFGFFVVAAYTSGMVTKYLGISPWLGILIGSPTR